MTNTTVLSWRLIIYLWVKHFIAALTQEVLCGCWWRLSRWTQKTAPFLVTNDSEAGCCRWTWSESLWDVCSGLKGLKAFSWCISRLCQYLRNVAFRWLFCVTSFYLAVTLDTGYHQWWQLCRITLGKTMWKAQPIISTIGLSTVTSLLCQHLSVFPSLGFYLLPWPWDLPWEGRSHWCFAVDVTCCLLPQNYLFKCFLCFLEWGGK